MFFIKTNNFINVKINKFSIILFILLIYSQSSMALTHLSDMKIVSHYFTTAIINSKKMIYTKNPSNGRYLILILSAKVNDKNGKIFNTDFILEYLHDNNAEDRSLCRGISICNTTTIKGQYDLSEFALSEYSWLNVKNGNICFSLAFFIEPDVEDINLYWLGSNSPINYHLESNRPFSVSIFANTINNDIQKAKLAIQKGGYQIIECSNSLVEDETGITIHYQEQAEIQAREISQRLTTLFGKITTLKTMALISNVDIIIWLGK